MNVADFIRILQKPDTILSPKQTRDLEDIIEEYPYFQAARALHLKGLKNLDSYKYNNALKVTAAHTADRDVLFDFITSQEFIQNNIADAIAGKEALEDKKTISEEIEPDPGAVILIGETEEALPQNAQDAAQILNPELFGSKEVTEEKPSSVKNQSEESGSSPNLNLGKPIPFTKKEKHSFREWLQLASKNQDDDTDHEAKEKLEKKKKFDLLDKFIESKPKIIPKDDLRATKVNIKESTKMDKNELMTETLAKVYLEQKKYKKAIQSFKILSLKYPEKNSFFADQIRAVKKLQKENE